MHGRSAQPIFSNLNFYGGTSTPLEDQGLLLMMATFQNLNNYSPFDTLEGGSNELWATDGHINPFLVYGFTDYVEGGIVDMSTSSPHGINPGEAVDDGKTFPILEIWTSDGTTKGTTFLKRLSNNSTNGDNEWRHFNSISRGTSGGRFVQFLEKNQESEDNTTEIWSTDFRAEGTILLDKYPGGFEDWHAVVMNDSILSDRNVEGFGYEMWKLCLPTPAAHPNNQVEVVV